MQLQLSFTLVGILASVARAHTIFTTLFINDVNQGDGTCVRMPMDSDTCTNPIAGLQSEDMACGEYSPSKSLRPLTFPPLLPGRDGQKAVAFTCPAPAGAKLTFEFREWADASNPGSIDKSHAGPCSVYLKRVSDMATTTATGTGWFKIWDSGYDVDAGKWCTEKLIADNGLLSVNLPTALPTGYYLVRPELLALQDAPDDPQFYVGCAQLFISGGGVDTLDVPADRDVSIPGHVASGQKSVTFNIYNSPLALPYSPPGPAVFFPISSPPRIRGRQRRATAAVQTQGQIPTNCLLKNANWCGREVARYTDESGCWAASEACYTQQADCYAQAPPTGDANCEVWGRKCKGIQEACGSGAWTGPPDAGKALAAVQAGVPGVIPEAGAIAGTAVIEGVETGDSENDASGGGEESAATTMEAPVASAIVVSPGCA